MSELKKSNEQKKNRPTMNKWMDVFIKMNKMAVLADIRNLYYKYKTRLVLHFTFKIGQIAGAPLLCSCTNHYPEKFLSFFWVKQLVSALSQLSTKFLGRASITT